MIMHLNLGDTNRDTLLTLTLPSNYGYCVLIAVGSVGVLTWESVKIKEARKFYNIPLPRMYSDTTNHFNCILMAHQKTLETYPQFLSLLLLGGLESPLWCAAGGAIHLLGRIAYAHGYYSGDPQNRKIGWFGHVGLLMMLGAAVKLAVHLIRLKY